MKRQTAGNGIVSGFFLPHPPVLLPEIGKGRETDAKVTGDAYIKAAARAAEDQPDTVIFISPHAPLFSDYLYCYNSPVLTGSFSRFGAPDLVFSAEQDSELRDAILTRLAAAGVPAGDFPAQQLERMGFDRDLDHGILVPLYFLQRMGTATKIVGFSSSAMDIPNLIKTGQCIAAAVRDTKKAVCVVASGDLSHKVNNESPYGMVKEGAMFDRAICEAIDSSNMELLYRMDPLLRHEAAECGFASLIVLSALYSTPRCTRYSYEAPFGIGYCVALFEQ